MCLYTKRKKKKPMIINTKKGKQKLNHWSLGLLGETCNSLEIHKNVILTE